MRESFNVIEWKITLKATWGILHVITFILWILYGKLISPSNTKFREQNYVAECMCFAAFDCTHILNLLIVQVLCIYWMRSAGAHAMSNILNAFLIGTDRNRYFRHSQKLEGDIQQWNASCIICKFLSVTSLEMHEYFWFTKHYQQTFSFLFIVWGGLSMRISYGWIVHILSV